MAIPEGDKSLTKGFAGNSGERQEREWPHKHWLSGLRHRFYNNLQDRRDCQNTRKSYKTSYVVGWIVGWKIAGERSGILRFASHDLQDRTNNSRQSRLLRPFGSSEDDR